MTRKNKHVGEDVSGYIRRRMAADSGLSTRVKEEFDKLQMGQTIKRLRQRNRLNQSELAELAGTKQPAIARMERGASIPRLDILYRIASAMGMRLDVRFTKIASKQHHSRR